MYANEQEEQIDAKSKIRSYFRRGLSYKEAFVQLCSDLNLPAISSEILEKIFQYVHGSMEPKDLDLGLDRKYCTRLFTLLEEYGLLRNGLASWPTDYDKIYAFKFLDPRYALLFERSDNDLQLFLLDNFHEQKRQLHTDDAFSNITRIQSLNVIDLEHCVLNGTTSRGEFYLYLLHLDYAKSECKCVESLKIANGGYDCMVIFDQKNQHNFVIWNNDKLEQFLRLGCIKNGQIVMDPLCISIDLPDLFCHRLIDGKLQTLVPKFEDNPENDDELLRSATFVEYSLISGKNYPPKNELSDITISKFLGYFDVDESACYWFGNKCYLLGSEAEIGQVVVLILDLETHKMSMNKTKFKCCGVLRDFYIEEQVVMMCTQLKRDQTFYVYRFPVNQPESLLNQALFKIRREYKDSLYKQMLPRLSPNLRPLAILNLDALKQESSGQSLSISNLKIE